MEAGLQQEEDWIQERRQHIERMKAASQRFERDTKRNARKYRTYRRRLDWEPKISPLKEEQWAAPQMNVLDETLLSSLPPPVSPRSPVHTDVFVESLPRELPTPLIGRPASPRKSPVHVDPLDDSQPQQLPTQLPGRLGSPRRSPTQNVPPPFLELPETPRRSPTGAMDRTPSPVRPRRRVLFADTTPPSMMSPLSETQSPMRRSPSPEPRSPSPRRRSPPSMLSPPSETRSPIRRSPSPQPRPPSPRRRSPPSMLSPLSEASSPVRRYPSPEPKTTSPRHRSPSRSPADTIFPQTSPQGPPEYLFEAYSTYSSEAGDLEEERVTYVPHIDPFAESPPRDLQKPLLKPISPVGAFDRVHLLSGLPTPLVPRLNWNPLLMDSPTSDLPAPLIATPPEHSSPADAETSFLPEDFFSLSPVRGSPVATQVQPQAEEVDICGDRRRTARLLDFGTAEENADAAWYNMVSSLPSEELAIENVYIPEDLCDVLMDQEEPEVQALQNYIASLPYNPDYIFESVAVTDDESRWHRMIRSFDDAETAPSLEPRAGSMLMDVTPPPIDSPESTFVEWEESDAIESAVAAASAAYSRTFDTGALPPEANRTPALMSFSPEGRRSRSPTFDNFSRIPGINTILDESMPEIPDLDLSDLSSGEENM